MTLTKTLTASLGECLTFNTSFVIPVTEGQEINVLLHIFIFPTIAFQ